MALPSFAFLSDFDFCGSIAGLMYSGKRRYKSKFGGVLTIMAFIGIIVITVFYLQVFFARETPKMSSNVLKYWDPPSLNVSENFTVAVMMQYSDKNEFRDDLVQVEVFYVKKNGTERKSSPLSKIPCKKEDFTTQETLFDTLELSKAVCFDVSGTVIQGSNVNDIFSYLQVQFLLCIEGDECYDQTQIESVFEKTKPLALIYFLDTVFDTTSKSNRIKRFINYLDINVTFNNAKETNIYFSQNEMNIDENYFFHSAPKVLSYFMVDSFRDKVSVRTKKQNQALLVNFMSSKNQEVISISFMQLSELLANISSLTNVIILVLSTIGDFINHFFFQNDLMNALYNFQTETKTNRRLSFKEKPPTVVFSFEKDLRTDSKMGFNNNPNKIIVLKKDQGSSIGSNGNLIDEVRKMKVKKNTYNISRKETKRNATIRDNDGHVVISATAFSHFEVFVISLYYFFDCCKCKLCPKAYRKTKQFKLIEDSMSSFQDFINVFKKLQEIDLLKYLLFKDDQLVMYGIIPKPECRYKETTASTPKNREKTEMDFSSFFQLKQYHYLKSINEINASLRNKILVEKVKMFFDKPQKDHLDEKLINILKDRIDLNV